MRSSRAALLLLLGAAVIQALYFYPRMPEVMASHFDGSGTPDAFQSRAEFFVFVGVLIALTVGLFGLIGPLLRRVPRGWLNLPEHWLAEGRFPQAIDELTWQMEWFGAGTMVLLVLVLQLVYETNLEPEPRLDASTMWWLLGLYVLFTVVWLVRLVRQFRRPA